LNNISFEVLRKPGAITVGNLPPTLRDGFCHPHSTGVKTERNLTKDCQMVCGGVRNHLKSGLLMPNLYLKSMWYTVISRQM
jgi:hypothetical protein